MQRPALPNKWLTRNHIGPADGLHFASTDSLAEVLTAHITKIEVDRHCQNFGLAGISVQLRDRVKGTKRTRPTSRVFVLSDAIFSTTVSCCVE